MQPIWVPLIIVTAFWVIIGAILPLFAKGPNKELIRVMLMLTSVCCYMFWLCTLLHQYKPLIGPQLSGEVAQVLQYLWGTNFN